MQASRWTRLLGDKKAHAEQARIAVTMLAVTALYAYVSRMFVTEYQFNAYEFVGTWASLVCVWLTRTQNILCWPWGILGSAALGMFFMQIGLPGQQWLNWTYFLIIQFWAWPHWAFGGAQKDELPVTSMSWSSRLVTLGVLAVSTVAVWRLIDVFAPGSSLPWVDALVVSASVTAQYLLGRKKVESWLLWLGPVNAASIALFFINGAYTVTALYVAFLIHAAIALRTWALADKKNRVCSAMGSSSANSIPLTADTSI